MLLIVSQWRLVGTVRVFIAHILKSLVYGNTFKLLDLCLDAKDSFKRAYTQIIHSSCDSLNSKVYLIVLVHVKSKKRLLMVIRSASESCNHSSCGAVT